MLKKIKNWLIKKLGGYTEAEFTAAINIGNETAKYAQKLAEPKKMAQGIKNYCNSNGNCEGCDFVADGKCGLDEIPRYWDVGGTKPANIKIEDLRVGDKVRIVDHRNLWWNCSGEMDHWMGKTMTIRKISNGNIDMKEDVNENNNIGWGWNVEDIAEVIKR